MVPASPPQPTQAAPRLPDIVGKGPPTPRYLVPFDPKSLPHYFTDVLIIGGGLAGLRAANEVDPGARCVVVTKDAVQESNSSYAQGGIASVWDPEDRFEDHVRDTLTAGGSLCDPAIVETVVREAPQRVSELIEWGTRFDSHGGALMLGREGGHSHQRIVHALGDATGREVMRAVIVRTRARPNVMLWEQAFTIDLLTEGGVCRGAIVARVDGQLILLWAKQTILCSGGCGQIYRESTNPPVATGDGHALAYRAGAELRDMEFMQFHPTVLYIAGSSRTLVTEAIRGAGAHLIDVLGNRFMSAYDQRMELAPRDVVSQAIVAQMDKTQHACVYLSLKHLDPVKVREEFPGFAQACQKFDLDITRDPIPVRPGAHYMIGGVVVDDEGRTSIDGLWAAGEVTSSGLHGANRLASNSLLEGVVFGARVGRRASERALAVPDDFRVPKLAHYAEKNRAAALDIADIRNSLQSLMWRLVGVQRRADRLEEALSSIQAFSRYVLPYSFSSEPGWELQNMITVAHLMAQAALARTESRGVHLRTDFPKLDEEHWRRHLRFVRP